MNIAFVVPSPVPFTYGGAERAWEGLVRAANERTSHRCELVSLPSPERDLADLVHSYGRFLDLDVTRFDRVITGKYPAWMVDHPAHNVFLSHRLRGLYDTYPAHLPPHVDGRDRFAELHAVLRSPPTPVGARRALEVTGALLQRRAQDPALSYPGPVARALVHYLDAVGLHPGPGRRYFAVSRTVMRRPGYFPVGVPVGVLETPSGLPGLRPGSYEYFFTASRLDAAKRLDLLVEAYRRVPGDVPLILAGAGPEAARLNELAAADDRVQLVGFVDDQSLAAHYRRALAVPFVPRDEDWGLVAVEAMSAATPVVTCTDSGGPAELVEHDRTGFVVPPTVDALAVALTRLVREPGLAERLGTAAHERAGAITWDRLLEPLLADDGGAGARSTGRKAGKPRLVVLSTFAIHPPRHGGQLRSWHLYRGLTERFDVELLCLGAVGDPVVDVCLAPGLVQRVVPRSSAHHQRDATYERRTGVAVDDIVAGLHVHDSPGFAASARASLADARVVLLAVPYLLEVAEEFAPGATLVYDAHNCESDLKRTLLEGRPAAEELLARVDAIEGRAVRTAAVRIACSAHDAERLAARHGVDASSILVVANGADVAATPFVSGALRARGTQRFLARYGASAATHVAVFVGSWHPPNVEAGRLLLNLATALPDMLFVLAGEHTSGLAREAPPANVVLAGPVSDLVKRGLLRAGTVGLNPVLWGSGTNLKLVEYLAAGLPVVTTPVGARGVPIVSGVHATVAPIGDFTDALMALVEDPRRNAMAAAGRALVEDDYAWPRLAARLTDAVAAAVA